MAKQTIPPLNELAARLEQALDRKLARQHLDAASPDHGGIAHERFGWVNIGHGAAGSPLFAGWLLVMLGRKSDASWIRRLDLIIDLLLTRRRPGGLADNPDCNIESAPDTAFNVQMLGALLTLERRRPIRHPSWAGARRKLERYIRQVAEPMAEGGFHTPNHRWVLGSALAMVLELNLVRSRSARGTVQQALRLYRDEMPDIDAHGFFVERSPVTYDAVSCRSLMFMSDYDADFPGLAATQRNIVTDTTLLNPDGSIETALSTRQDQLSSQPPTALAACAVMLQTRGRRRAIGHDVSGRLWGMADRFSLNDLAWLTWAALEADDGKPGGRRPSRAQPLGKPLPDVGWDALDASGPVVRFRAICAGKPADALTDATTQVALSALPGQRRLLRGVWARTDDPEQSIRLEGLYLRVSYFGAAGDFIADRIESRPQGIRLICQGDRQLPRRPGYEAPLGQPIAADDWETSLSGRPVLRKPLASGTLDIHTDDPAAIRMTWKANPALPENVPAQVTMDFSLPQRLVAGTMEMIPQAGQTILMGDSCRLERSVALALTLEGGAKAHRAMDLRDGPPMDDPRASFRLVINLQTPVSQTWRIRARSMSKPANLV
ncbi:MAG: hypothetical protein JJU36_08695 [Phycisphaeraceae bacterium]|nr:hypothetical protein [Phycisphaeraceae bacterium]